MARPVWHTHITSDNTRLAEGALIPAEITAKIFGEAPPFGIKRPDTIIFDDVDEDAPKHRIETRRIGLGSLRCRATFDNLRDTVTVTWNEGRAEESREKMTRAAFEAIFGPNTFALYQKRNPVAGGAGRTTEERTTMDDLMGYRYAPDLNIGHSREEAAKREAEARKCFMTRLDQLFPEGIPQFLEPLKPTIMKPYKFAVVSVKDGKYAEFITELTIMAINADAARAKAIAKAATEQKGEYGEEWAVTTFAV